VSLLTDTLVGERSLKWELADSKTREQMHMFAERILTLLVSATLATSEQQQQLTGLASTILERCV